MLDGRQVAILARHFAGDHDTAFNLLDGSSVSESWEQAVATFLRALCTAEQSAEASMTGVVDASVNLGPTPRHPRVPHPPRSLRTRPCPDVKAPHLAARATHEGLTSMDAYIARDVLSHHPMLLEHVRCGQDHARAGVRPEPRHHTCPTPR